VHIYLFQMCTRNGATDESSVILTVQRMFHNFKSVHELLIHGLQPGSRSGRHDRPVTASTQKPSLQRDYDQCQVLSSGAGAYPVFHKTL
jgi:hypothetical protein